MKIRNQNLTFVKPMERPEAADPPTKLIPTEAIPPGYTGPIIVTKKEAKQMLASSNQSESEQRSIRASRQQGKAIENLFANILQQTLLNKKQSSSSQQIATSSNALSGGNSTDLSARREIEKLMREYDPESGDADETAVEISKRKDLLPHLTAKEQEQLVMGLFDGATSEQEEDAAMEILRGASDENLKKIVNSIGWDRLKNELDPEDIDEISKRLANPKATASNSASSKILENFGINNSSEEIGEIKRKINQKLDSMSPSEIESLSNETLANKNSVLSEIAMLERSGKGTQAAALRTLVDQLKGRANGELKNGLDQFSYQIRYTSEINGRLKSGDYSGLLENMRDMADPTKSNAERTAIYETLRALDPELRAMEEAIQLYGNSKQKADAEVFMKRYRTFMNTFDPNDSAGDFLDKLGSKLDLAGQSIEDKFDSLRSQTANMVSELPNLVKLGNFLDTLSDDEARELVNNLYSKESNGENHLASLPTDYKVRLINNMIAGFTGDEEEQAILKILRETKKKNPQEFYQIISAVGYEELNSNIDGQENLEFQQIMRD